MGVKLRGRFLWYTELDGEGIDMDWEAKMCKIQLSCNISEVF